MKLKDFISQKFKIDVKPDDEGVYSFIFKDYDGKVSIENNLKKYTENTDGNILMLECDDDNFMSLKNKFGKIEIFEIDGTKISGADFLDDEYEDVDGNEIKEYALILYSNSWIKRYLRIDLYPNLKVSLEIDYDKYDTNEEGFIIWE